MSFRKNILLAGLAVLMFSCNTTREDTAGDTSKQPVDYVNPLIGTAPLTDPSVISYTPPKDWRVWAGLVFPGSSLPNAMIQLSPITEWRSGAGYEYEDEKILGFTHTNKGHWNLCNLPILPVPAGAAAPFGSAFNHATEHASPAYYEVLLEDYGIHVRLTSSLRAAVHEYTFKNGGARKILFDLGHANNRVAEWDITVKGDSVIEGMQRIGRDRIHFYATVSAGIKDIAVVEKGQSNGYAVIDLGEGDHGKVVLKLGMSFVSAANAAENLEKEIGGASFDDVHRQGRATWQELLARIQVQGGTEKQKELFYTSLYRAFLWPALWSDSNGEFTDDAGNVRNEGFRYYTVPSLWDTYRNKLVLLSIMQPDVTADVIQSLINRGEISGFIPTFFHGDHAASFITGAYLRGIRDFDVKKAYELLLNNAYKEGGTRPHIAEYIAKGYISDVDEPNPNVETRSRAGVAKTLEFSYDDYSLSLFARAMGDKEHEADLRRRSKNYKNVFDTSTHFMRGRLEDGRWISPFNPQYPYYEYMYREANAWQVSFYAVHDMPGLVDLHGGAGPFEAKLDSFFTLPWNPEYIARNVSCMMGQYCQGNQPDHEAPFSYYFIGKPEKSQAVLDHLLDHYFGIGEQGLALPGMDDAGEMSSWYVFNALGLYPFSPTDPEYLVTVPVFNKVTWTLNNGQELVIKNDNNTRALKSITVNGRDIAGYFVGHDLFEKGGTITVNTGE